MKEDNNLCTLYIVRHGETEWNAKGITQGQSNSILTENGIEQAKTTANILKDIHFDAIFSSDLIRTKHTTEIIKLDRDILIQTSKLLRERTYGDFETKHGDEFKEAIKEKLKERENLSDEENWKLRLANGVETDEEVITRFLIQLREIAIAYPNKAVLVTTHAGPMKMLLLKLGYTNRKEMSAFYLKNAGYIKVLSDGINFFIKEVVGVSKPKGSDN